METQRRSARAPRPAVNEEAREHDDERAHARARIAVTAERRERLAIVFHGDADGVSSAALAGAAAARLGAKVSARTTKKGESVYAPAFWDALRGEAEACVVVDTGARADVSWRVVPTVIVDHHPTERRPDVEAFVHDVDALSTSMMTLDLVAPLVDVSDRAWLAAIGALGDRGDAARAAPNVAESARQFGIGTLREIVALVNAAGRAASPANEIAYEALANAPDPRALLASEGDAIRALRVMRREVADAIKSARRVPPRPVGRWAIIELSEPCRIHGVIASTWSRRLAPRIVLVANRGYMPGRVHLSVRAEGDVDLRRALRDLLPDEGHDFAAGHVRASGAIIDVPTYERLLEAIRREAAPRAAS